MTGMGLTWSKPCLPPGVAAASGCSRGKYELNAPEGSLALRPPRRRAPVSKYGYPSVRCRHKEREQPSSFADPLDYEHLFCYNMSALSWFRSSALTLFT